MTEQIESNTNQKATSRRRFLGMLSLGVAGAAVLVGVLPFARRTTQSDAASEFPGPGSIFHPAQDPRSDPRR